MKRIPLSFRKREIFIWALSVAVIFVAFFIGEDKSYLSLAASLIGATALIFNAKGDFTGQFFMVVFAVLYAIVSYEERYYGEMITYLGMTLPSGLISALIWMKNTKSKAKREVKIRKITAGMFWCVTGLTVAVTVAFYFILGALNTNNLIVSTISVATSFFASALTLLRSPYFGLAYALNDIVLIALWSMSVAEDISYIPTLMCFCVFLINDVYSFFNWLRLRKLQSAVSEGETIDGEAERNGDV